MEEHNNAGLQHEESASEAIYPASGTATIPPVKPVSARDKRFGRWLNGWHIACFVLIIGVGAYLIDRASDEDRWSDWGFGDAQTLLSLKQWNENGWAANYFLFIPQGYAKAITLLDDPNLRQHAHGTCPGSSPRVGPRLWYTHYPAGYLVPYAAMFAAGFQTKFAAQMLSIFLSLAALALMYAVFARITTPYAAFFATLFYAISRPFLGFADTLANQPLDDLLRFGFMLAVVLSTRGESEKSRQRWMIAAWLMEFALSLSSFDSVFFLFTWLVGWDLLERRGFRWKVWFIYGMAPVTAHGLQFLQNVWYLGFQDALIDIKDAFLLKNGADANYNFGESRLSVIKGSLGIIFYGILNSGKVLWGLIGAYIFHAIFLGKKDDRLPSIGLLLLLFLAGLSFILVLPHAARMPYEARQMLPFVSLLVAGLLVAVVKAFAGVVVPHRIGSFAKVMSIVFLLLALPIIVISTKHVMNAEREPTYPTQLKFMPDIQFAKELKRNLRTRYEPVIFDVGGFQMFWDPKYVPGYPQILPLIEFYAGSRPILCFNFPEWMAKDLVYLVRNSPYRFSPILTSRDPARLNIIMSILNRSGVLNGNPVQIYNVMDDIYLVDLSHSVIWGNK